MVMAERGANILLCSLSLPLSQGVLGFTGAEDVIQTAVDYLEMIPDPHLARQYLVNAAKAWPAMQTALLTQGSVAYWTQRRTMLMLQILHTRTTVMNQMCKVHDTVLAHMEVYHVLWLCRHGGNKATYFHARL